MGQNGKVREKKRVAETEKESEREGGGGEERENDIFTGVIKSNRKAFSIQNRGRSLPFAVQSEMTISGQCGQMLQRSVTF